MISDFVRICAIIWLDIQAHSQFIRDPEAVFPSSYADGGFVQWSKARMSKSGELIVRFPNIRWDRLRATEGWAALQYHSLLHSTFTAYPPTNASHKKDKTPKLKIDLLRGSFFAILPFNSSTQEALEWHVGNIYEDTFGQSEAIIEFPGLSWDQATCFHILISGDYEVRSFGPFCWWPLWFHSRFVCLEILRLTRTWIPP